MSYDDRKTRHKCQAWRFMSHPKFDSTITARIIFQSGNARSQLRQSHRRLDSGVHSLHFRDDPRIHRGPQVRQTTGSPRRTYHAYISAAIRQTLADISHIVRLRQNEHFE